MGNGWYVAFEARNFAVWVGGVVTAAAELQSRQHAIIFVHYYIHWVNCCTVRCTVRNSIFPCRGHSLEEVITSNNSEKKKTNRTTNQNQE